MFAEGTGERILTEKLKDFIWTTATSLYARMLPERRKLTDDRLIKIKEIAFEVIAKYNYGEQRIKEMENIVEIALFVLDEDEAYKKPFLETLSKIKVWKLKPGEWE